MHSSSAPRETPHAIRGIWRAPYLQDGYPVIIAVDSRGRRVGSIVMVRGLTPSRVRRVLADLLEAADPIIHLRLVKETPDTSAT